MNTKMNLPWLIAAATVEFPALLLSAGCFFALAGMLHVPVYVSFVSVFVIHYFYYEQVFYKRWRKVLLVVINTSCVTALLFLLGSI
ncbi:hypothetical protein CHL76_13070 [Marinococcus halophilus]|uniref:hypothetical protein n=1 Tax=Marinococcus halophilus TaxID=1371 RepID=UPI000BA06CE0|nr:hypothetical protein [Marinococcus halophilus]OZT79341.1 hypothetical protein CHL76_13070 [Marinococcus halophilus]